MINDVMKTITRYIFLIVAFAVAAALARSGVSVQSLVDKNQILIGDVLTYSVRVSHPDSVELQMPSPAANLGAFEIRDYKMLESVREEESIVDGATFWLSTFDTGEYEIPELSIRFRSKGDSTWQQVFSEPILITVASLNPDSTGDIRDIKPPITPPRDYRAIVKWSLIGLLMAALIAFLLYYLKRRREGKSLLPKRARPPRPAHELALEALDKLAAEELLERGEVKEYYSRLSDIIRQYIENRYFIPAMEMTTTQLLGAMQEAALAETDIARMADFLATCDLVKFAAVIPDKETHSQKTKTAYDFVQATKLIIQQEQESEQNQDLSETDSAVPMNEEANNV